MTSKGERFTVRRDPLKAVLLRRRCLAHVPRAHLAIGSFAADAPIRRELDRFRATEIVLVVTSCVNLYSCAELIYIIQDSIADKYLNWRARAVIHIH